MRRHLARLLPAALALVLAAPAAQAAGTLRFGLEFDPDVLDPARNGSYTDRIVFASMCDQLLDTSPQLDYVPQLATKWEWSADRKALTIHLREGVRFQDGEPMDAEAVRANLQRYLTAPESIRKAELAPVAGVQVLDPLTLRIDLKTPFAPLLALLANRPGTPMSPKLIAQGADAVAAHPVCAGAFRFVERVAQDRIVLERFPGYWNAQAVALDRIVFRPIVDSTVRLVNLQSGALDIVNRLAPTDVGAVTKDPKLRLARSPSIGFQIMSFNLHNGPAADTPFGRDPRVREAFEKAIDRNVINQVVYDGQYVPNNQTEPPNTRYWDPDHPVPARDVEGAKALLRQAGVERVRLRLQVANDPIAGQVAQIMQAMAAEAGFDVTIEQVESNAALQQRLRGDYQASMVIWSGRPDPDQNLRIWMACDAPLNWGKYCNPTLDQVMNQGATETDPEKRVPIYRRATDIWTADRPYMVLYHFTWLWGLSDRVEGFVPHPDGVARTVGLRLKGG